jgi:hypothetical protein
MRTTYDNGRRRDGVLLRSNAGEGYLIVFSFAEAQCEKRKDDYQSEESVHQSQLADAYGQEFLVRFCVER